jgi:hypothetical protein
MQASAQTEKAATERLVASKNFVFKATRANPINEPSLNQIVGPAAINNLLDLSGERYYLRVTKEMITADLPFFGRSYSASMNPAENGIKFSSKDFTYSSTRKKKDWIVTIEPKDVQDSQKLTLRISDSGYATLNVNNYNRQAISFDGSIVKLEPSKKD